MLESGCYTAGTNLGDGETVPSDRPGVVAPPPLVFLAFFGAGALLEWLWPTPALPSPAAYGGAALGLGITVALVLAARRRFREAGTNVEPTRPATALVTEGIYGRTRNPMYLALALGHAGIAVGFGFLWALASLVPALLVIHFGVVRREERYLDEKFGEPYRRYASETPRWFWRP